MSLRRALRSHLKECLTSLEDHAVVDLEQLVHKQPGAIRAWLGAITVLEDPVTVLIHDCALESTQLVIVESDVAGRHSTDHDPLIRLEVEDLVKLGAVDELELDSIQVRTAALRLMVLTRYVAVLVPALTLEEVDSQVRSAERYDEAILEYKRRVKPDKCSRSLA